MSYINRNLDIQLQVRALPFFDQINKEDQMQVQYLPHFHENIILICCRLLHVVKISKEYVQQAFFYL